MRLYFIRHGQSANNVLSENTGSDRGKGRSEDPELTFVGHEQSRLLGNFILTKDEEARADGKTGESKRDFFGFTHLYTSLMIRSVSTAMYVSQALSLPLYAWPDLHETGGIYLDDEISGRPVGLPGKTRSYFTTNYKDLILPEMVTNAGWWNRPFEAYEECPLRARQVWAMLLERHGGTDDRVAIVSHGGFYMELIRALFDIRQENAWFTMFNTAISRFDCIKNGQVLLIYHNRTDHLPEKLIT